jgi:hypothetical protein
MLVMVVLWLPKLRVLRSFWQPPVTVCLWFSSYVLLCICSLQLPEDDQVWQKHAAIFNFQLLWLSQSHFTADSQSVSQSVCLGVEPTLWMFDQILLPFQEFGSGVWCPDSVGRPLWQEAVSVLCKSQSSHLSMCTFIINIFVFHTFTIYIYIYIYTLYNTYNIHKASFSPSSVEQIMPYYSHYYYSFVAHTTTAV